MEPTDHFIKNIERKPCGCTFTDYASGRKTYEPCVSCGLMRAGWLLSKAQRWFRRGRNLLEAGNCLAAVATTIAKAANQMNVATKAIDKVMKDKDE